MPAVRISRPAALRLAALALAILPGAASAGVATERPGMGRSVAPGPVPTLGAPQPGITARFDPAARATHVTAAVSGACASLDLPLAWTLGEAEDGAARLQAAGDGPALDLALRPAGALPPVPTLASRGVLLAADDLPRRAAAALQREHEDALGRPAGSVTLTPLAPGALRLTATWLDPSLPAPLTHDTVVLALTGEWVMTLTLSGAETREMHEEVLGEVMERVRVGRGC